MGNGIGRKKRYVLQWNDGAHGRDSVHVVAMHPFERLLVWQKAHELTLRVFHATGELVEKQCPGLSKPMRRAAASIAANIAEGTGFESQKQFARYLDIAIASARELQYHIRLAADLSAINVHDRATLEARADEVARMLAGLRRTVKKRGSRSGPVAAVETVAPVPTAAE